MRKLGSYAVVALGLWSIAFLTAVSLAIIGSDASANDQAIIKMALCLVIVWVIMCGGAMHLFRDRFATFSRSVPIGWKVKFFVSVSVLMLVEEAIATSITNLAPAFGGTFGEAYITASSNFITVIVFHSVVMFVPFILIWIYLLTRYDFTVVQVFLLFGLLGTIAESFLSPIALVSGFWFFIYGLMIYLPAYALPKRANLKRPTLLAYGIAIILPFIVAAPMSLIVLKVGELVGAKSFLGT